MALERTLDEHGNFIIHAATPVDKDSEKDDLLLEIAQLKAKVKELEGTNSDLVKITVELQSANELSEEMYKELEAEHDGLLEKIKKQAKK